MVQTLPPVPMTCNGMIKNGRLLIHFIPFSEQEVGAPDRFESDFMINYLQAKTFSPEALNVKLNEGRKLWQAYFAKSFERKIRDDLKLNRSDVGWYQIRKALEANNKFGNGLPTDFTPFKSAYDNLSTKLRPMVYQLGFLK